MKNASKLTEVDQIPIITTCTVHCVQPDLMVDRIKYEYDLGIVINSSPSLAGHVCVYLIVYECTHTTLTGWEGLHCGIYRGICGLITNLFTDLIMFALHR